MYRIGMVMLFGLLAGAVAAGIGDFTWLSHQASGVVFWVVPPLTAIGAILGLFRHRHLG
jgi:uncharacterized membrane protein